IGVDAAGPFSIPPLGKSVLAQATRMVVSGNLVYALYDRQLRIVDISTDAAPQVVGSLTLPDYAEDVAFYGSIAVVADNAAGICLVNVSNPASPPLFLTLDTPGNAPGIAMSGSPVLISD